jgi:glycosyltransferase involved in cell wall biosynthesis
MSEPRLRIAIVSKADSSGGGAGRVPEDLCRGLLDAGHEAIHWVSWTKKGYTPTRRRLYGELWQRKFYRWTRNVRRWFIPDLIPFELPNLYLQNIRTNFDLIHFHDLSSAISPMTVSWFARRMPTLLTLHDTSAFTGGCINPMDCTGYLTGCGRCPQHGTWPIDGRFDWTRANRSIHHRMLANPNLGLVIPSRWLCKTLETAMTPARPPAQIVNGVDTQTFRPAADRAVLRRQLGLVDDRPVVVIASTQLSNPLKGIAHSRPALEAAAEVFPQTVVIGEPDDAARRYFAGVDVRYTGHLSEPRELARRLQAADVLLYPSLADNQPLTVLEAMGCGCAVVAYATGGIPEIAPNQTTGVLVPTGDGHALGAALTDVLRDKARLLAFQRAAADRVTALHSLEGMVENHVNHYRAVINAKRRADP